MHLPLVFHCGLVIPLRPANSDEFPYVPQRPYIFPRVSLNFHRFPHIPIGSLVFQYVPSVPTSSHEFL
jgi:hypothetical protein